MQPKKILIVEDDKTMVTLMTAMLRKGGHTVFAGFDAAAGRMVPQKERPDLILLDLQMPAGGGAATWKRLRMSAHTSSIPGVYGTATGPAGFAAEAEAQGAAGFIRKPFEPESFLARVEEFFKRATGQMEQFEE